LGDPSTASSIHHARLSLWSRGGGSTLHPHQSRDPQGYASPLPRCKGHRSHHQSCSFQFAHVNLVSLTATFCIIQNGLVIDQCMHPLTVLQTCPLQTIWSCWQICLRQRQCAIPIFDHSHKVLVWSPSRWSEIEGMCMHKMYIGSGKMTHV